MSLNHSRVSRTLRGTLIGRSVRGSLLRLGLLGALVTIFAASCAEGTYPLDFFYEMHYQPSYHPQEPPRLMPAEGAVPITGKDVTLKVAVDELDTIINPIPGEGVERGAELYAINCSMCHGVGGQGDGQVLKTMIEKYGYTPKLNTNLTLVNVFGYSDGKLFATISNRDLRPEIAALDPSTNRVMPQFQKLLTAQERWMLVNYLKTLGGP